MPDVPETREVTITAEHDGTERKHTFWLSAKAGYGDLIAFVSGGGDKQLITADRVLRRSLIDTDGTPLKWSPVVTDDHFTAPDGTRHHVDELPAFTAFDAGSSRRRWYQLAYDNDEVYIDPTEIITIVDQLAEDASEGRPTRR
jgi:hypothetical protein